MVGLAPKWNRLAPNGTNLGLFKIKFLLLVITSVLNTASYLFFAHTHISISLLYILFSIVLLSSNYLFSPPFSHFLSSSSNFSISTSILQPIVCRLYYVIRLCSQASPCAVTASITFEFLSNRCYWLTFNALWSFLFNPLVRLSSDLALF